MYHFLSVLFLSFPSRRLFVDPRSDGWVPVGNLVWLKPEADLVSSGVLTIRTMDDVATPEQNETNEQRKKCNKKYVSRALNLI